MTTLPPTAPYPSSGIPPSVPPTHLTSLGHLVCSGNMTSYRRGVQLHGGATFTWMLSHVTSPLIGSVYTGVIGVPLFFYRYSQVGQLSPLSLPPIAKAIRFTRMLSLSAGVFPGQRLISRAHIASCQYTQLIVTSSVDAGKVRHTSTRPTPFGLRSAPNLFTTVADAATWALMQAGITFVLYYLDDHLFFLPPSSLSSTLLLSQGRGIFDVLAVPVADDKVDQGHIFLRHLYDVQARTGSPYHHVHLDAKTRADLPWWEHL